jgi:hypothetical protein
MGTLSSRNERAERRPGETLVSAFPPAASSSIITILIGRNLLLREILREAVGC